MLLTVSRCWASKPVAKHCEVVISIVFVFSERKQASFYILTRHDDFRRTIDMVLTWIVILGPSEALAEVGVHASVNCSHGIHRG